MADTALGTATLDASDGLIRHQHTGIHPQQFFLASISAEVLAMASRGLRHVALRTRDLIKTERFYVDVLGMEVAFRVPPNMIFLRTPGGDDLLNFVRSGKSVSANQGFDHLGFKVTKAGLKRLETILKDKRIPIEGRRGRTALYIRDPNGYSIEHYCD
jgi:catechol-2,3-dioxygenase